VPCLTEGTLITTERGEIAVEKLRVGDRVLTRDHGFQPLKWIGARRLTGRFLLDNPHLRPVRIAEDAFGDHMPTREVMVSPNTRLPVIEEVGGILHRESEDLVAVKYMVNQGSIQQIDTIGTTYFLMMFETHEFVAANGFWSECFHPGDWSLGARGNAQRTEIFEIFPDVAATMRRREERVANRRRVRKGAFRVMYGKKTRDLPDLAM
jgi:hypothetical protein